MLEPCPGCGALFPASKGPTHRYIGASAGCWHLFGVLSAGAQPDLDTLSRSSIDPTAHRVRPASHPRALGMLFGDAYAVQHHGDGSPQAVQSVGVHLMVLHASVAQGVDPSNRLWALGRALRRRGVFHKLRPPPRGQALTIRHLFAGGGVDVPWSRDEYVASVYRVWADAHLTRIQSWYDRYVVPDRLEASDKNDRV